VAFANVPPPDTLHCTPAFLGSFVKVALIVRLSPE
jgi:hypothetical protein